MAAANILQSYLIKLGVDADKKSLDSFVGAVHRGLAGMAKMGAATVGAFAAIQVGVMKLAGSEAALNDLSDRVGMSVDQIERLSYVASQTGSSAQQLHSSMQSLSEIAGNAAAGMAGAVKVFDDLGMSATKTNGEAKDTATLLDEIGHALSGKSRSEQNSFLKRLGIDRTLIRTLTEDTSGLRAEFDAMSAAAGVDFEKTANAASDLMDEIGKTTTFTKLLGKAVGADLMQDLAGGMKWLRQKIRENVAGIRSGVEVVTKVAKVGTIVVGGFLSRLAQGFLWLHEKTAGLSTALLAVKATMMLIGAPVLAIIAVLAGLYLVIDDLWTALEGGESLIDWGPWLGDIRAARDWLLELGSAVKNWIIPRLEEAWEWLKKIWPEVKGGLGSGVDAIREWIASITPTVKAEFDKCLKSVEEWWGKVKNAFKPKSGNEWIENLKLFFEIVKSIAEYVASGAWDTVKLAFGLIGDGILTAIQAAKDLADTLKSLIKGDFAEAEQSIRNLFGSLGGFIENVFKTASDIIEGLIGKAIAAADKVRALLGLSVKTPEEVAETKKKGLDYANDVWSGEGPTNAWMTDKKKSDSRPQETSRSESIGSEIAIRPLRENERTADLSQRYPYGIQPMQPQYSFATSPALPQGKSVASMERANVTNNQGAEISQTFDIKVQTTSDNPKAHGKAIADVVKTPHAGAARYGVSRVY